MKIKSIASIVVKFKLPRQLNHLGRQILLSPLLVKWLLQSSKFDLVSQSWKLSGRLYPDTSQISTRVHIFHSKLPTRINIAAILALTKLSCSRYTKYFEISLKLQRDRDCHDRTDKIWKQSENVDRNYRYLLQTCIW